MAATVRGLHAVASVPPLNVLTPFSPAIVRTHLRPNLGQMAAPAVVRANENQVGMAVAVKRFSHPLGQGIDSDLRSCPWPVSFNNFAVVSASRGFNGFMFTVGVSVQDIKTVPSRSTATKRPQDWTGHAANLRMAVDGRCDGGRVNEMGRHCQFESRTWSMRTSPNRSSKPTSRPLSVTVPWARLLGRALVVGGHHPLDSAPRPASKTTAPSL